MKRIVGVQESRIKTVAKDIVEHFRKKTSNHGNTVGKAMIVAMSRRIAVELYEAIVKTKTRMAFR